jgi:hypothetical protein
MRVVNDMGLAGRLIPRVVSVLQRLRGYPHEWRSWSASVWCSASHPRKCE